MGRGGYEQIAIAKFFDAEADAAYVYLQSPTERPAEQTRFCKIPLDDAAINVDFDVDGRVVRVDHNP